MKKETGKERPERSAGCLVYRFFGEELRFLLVHPAGASFRKRLFSIPKGLLEGGEDPRETALRETEEETGLKVRIMADLGTCTYKSGKVILAFLAEPVSGYIDEKGRTKHDWEVDVSKFYPPEECRRVILPAQEVFIERALSILKEKGLLKS